METKPTKQRTTEEPHKLTPAERILESISRAQDYRLLREMNGGKCCTKQIYSLRGYERAASARQKRH